MGEELRAHMLFEIGDLVFIKGSQHTMNHRPKEFVITERFVQQCYGGTQKLYKLHTMDGLHPEIALTCDEPPYRKVSSECLADEMNAQVMRLEVRNMEWPDIKKESEDILKKVDEE